MSASASSRSWIPAAMLLGALSLTCIAAGYVVHVTRMQDKFKWQREVQASVREVQTHIASQLSSYIAILRGGCGLFAADGTVSRQQFKTYVDQLSVEQNYKGLIAIGFAPAIQRSQIPALAAAAQTDGLDDFKIFPDPERDVVVPVLYLEPQTARTVRAIGYDMFSDISRRAAMEAARDTGWPSATNRVLLIQTQDSAQQPGFLIYLPIYRGGRAPESIPERRNALIGFIYSPFRCNDLFGDVMAPSESTAEFAVYNGPLQTPANLLYASAPAAVQSGPDNVVVPLAVRGVSWTLVFTPKAGVREDRSTTQGLAVLGVGIAISIGLFALTLAQARARRSAEAARVVAEQAASDLRRSEEALRESLEDRKQGEADRARLLASEQAARADAETANRSKDEFLATLSHELRTPLNAILGWAQLLKMGDLDPEETSHGVETIERNAKVQAQLVEDLLDVSRIISGKIRLDLRPLELPPVIESALDSVRPAAAAKRIRIVPVLDAHAGQVLGDADRLQQVIWNLLSNAIKFTPVGGRVEVMLQRVGEQIEIAIIDNGQGIKPEFLPFVFDRLRQADGSSTRRHGGLGLGLAIVRHLTELQGGTVSARSRGPGLGSTFSVYFPIVSYRRSGGDSAAPGASSAGSKEDRQLQGLRILVVEDEPDARELLGRVLSKAGADVASAASAAEAMQEFEQRQPQVLISDISMPVEDGYTLMRKIRLKTATSGGRVAALALSAFAREEDRREARAAGFDAHMSKPFDPADLISTAARLSTRERPARSSDGSLSASPL